MILDNTNSVSTSTENITVVTVVTNSWYLYKVTLKN